jgi:16S rRNA (uracil1498-N3)-methyltransferase
MPQRFLIQTPTPAQGDELQLDAERTHYLCKVMRHRTGDSVACFNGNGVMFNATVLNTSRKAARLQISEIAPAQIPHAPAVHLALSILKGQAMDRALQQATELGVAQIHLLQANRSNVTLKADRTDNKLTHWQKIISSACEQCGQLYVPALSPPVSPAELLSDTALKTFVLDQQGEVFPDRLDTHDIQLLIGPEGGWDESERLLFQQQNIPAYCVAPFTLRAETMPAVALATVYHAQHVVDAR